MKSFSASIFILLLLSASVCKAQTFSTLNDGAWITGSTWIGGSSPNYSSNWWPDSERNANVNHDITLGSGGDNILFNGFWNQIYVSNGATITANVNTLTIEDSSPSWTTNFSVDNGTLIINGDLIVKNNGELNIGASGNVVINGNLTVTGGGGSVNISSGGTLDINGTLRLEGGPNSNLNNSGYFEADNVIVTGGANQFNTSSTANIIEDFAVNGSGLLNVTDGTLSIGDDFTNTGGATTTIDGYLTAAGDIYNSNNIYGTGGIAWEGTWTSNWGRISPDNNTQTTSPPPHNPYNLATGGPYNVVLPVTLLYFDAKAFDQTVELLWATAEEENFDYFTVERSGDGKEFEAIGKVYSEGTNTKTRRDYSMKDLNPVSGTTYYRLKATDFDGTEEYFKIIYVNFEPQDLSASLYPNPASGEYLTIALNSAIETAEFQLFNLSGALMYQQEITFPVNKINFDVQLERGVYVAVVNTPSESKSFKWLVK